MSEKREERIASIYSYLSEHNYASVSELASIFNVSRSTIKRDIDVMADKHMTERVHGGMFINLTHEDPPYLVRKNLNLAAKVSIAQAAASLVEDNDVILLLGGITCFEVYKAIRAKNVTVFSLNPETLLTNNKNVSHLYVLEGQVSPEYGVIDGSLTIENLSRISPAKVFFSTSLNDDFVLQCRTDRELALILTIAKMDICKILVADKSKMRVRQTFSAFSLDKVDIFVTDFELKASQKKAFEDCGVRIMQVDQPQT